MRNARHRFLGKILSNLAVFLEWMERLQKCVQADGEYVGWAKRTQYIGIDFNHEVLLCCTWRETPHSFHEQQHDSETNPSQREIHYSKSFFLG
jgi:hypothetical protein